MLSLEKIIHIIPLGYEFDRAIKIFEYKSGLKANRVYLLSSLKEEVPYEIRKRHEVYLEKVKNKLEEFGIEVIIIPASLIDLLDIMQKVSYIVKKETTEKNIVYINMSAAGRMTSVGATLAGMVQGAKVYYIESDGYSDTDEGWEKHGLSIVKGVPRVKYLENFQINFPNIEQQFVLVKLFLEGTLSAYEIIKYLTSLKMTNFNVKLENITRKDRTRITMMLNRSVMDKLLSSGYVLKEKLSKETIYSITESGKYIACISGLLDENSSYTLKVSGKKLKSSISLS